MRALVIDFETSGLLLPDTAKPEQQPRIIEIGAALVTASGEIEETLERLIFPGIKITDEITRITKLTNEDLANAMHLKSVLPELRALFIRAALLVAHNLPFDKGVLTHELRRCHALEDWPWPAQELCTVTSYVHEFGFKPKLIELYARKLGKPLAQKHRAFADVLALVEILRADKILETLLDPSTQNPN